VSASLPVGYVKRFQKRLDEDPALMEIYRACNVKYAAARWGIMSDAHKVYAARCGYDAILRDTGVGGMRLFNQVKCLHVHYAHFLACGGEDGGGREGSLVGRWTAEAMREVCAHVTPPAAYRHGRTAARAATAGAGAGAAGAGGGAGGGAGVAAGSAGMESPAAYLAAMEAARATAEEDGDDDDEEEEEEPSLNWDA
jgi:hypothetical protein